MVQRPGVADLHLSVGLTSTSSERKTRREAKAKDIGSDQVDGASKARSRNNSDSVVQQKHAPDEARLHRELKAEKARSEHRFRGIGVQNHAHPCPPPKDIDTLLDEHQGNALTTAFLQKLKATPGFNQLNGYEPQERLLLYVGGTNKLISQPARDALDQLLDSNGFMQADAAEQADRLTRFVNEEQGTPWRVGAEEGFYDGRRRDYTKSKPELSRASRLFGPIVDVQRYDVRIGDKKIPVFMPMDRSSDGHMHSIDEIAKGLAALPDWSLNAVKRVLVHPRASPSDAHWSKVYQTPGFRTYMDAGADGNINIYPSDTRHSQTTLDANLIHETAHIKTDQLWGGDKDDLEIQPEWLEWKDATKQDPFSPSGYATKSLREDVSETLQLYETFKDDPVVMDEMEAMMPNRMNLIRQVYRDLHEL